MYVHRRNQFQYAVVDRIIFLLYFAKELSSINARDFGSQTATYYRIVYARRKENDQLKCVVFAFTDRIKSMNDQHILLEGRLPY